MIRWLRPCNTCTTHARPRPARGAACAACVTVPRGADLQRGPERERALEGEGYDEAAAAGAAAAFAATGVDASMLMLCRRIAQMRDQH